MSRNLFRFFFCGAALVFFSWLVSSSIHCPLPEEKTPVFFYSNHTNHSLKIITCKALKKAKHSIFLMMYSVNDPDVLALLEEKARKGLKITLLMDAKEIPPTNESYSFDFLPVHSAGLMHRKIMIVDEEDIFIGSANLTSASLKLHDNFMIGMHHPDLASQITHHSKSIHEFSIADRKAELYLLPEPNQKALDVVIKEILHAQKTIRVAMFTLSHPKLIEALIAAFKKGVKVEIAVDFFTGQGASHESILKLHQAGIPVYLSSGAQLFHHKWAWIDKKILISGSTNWTQAAFEKNQDDFLLLYSLNGDQKKFMRKMWKTILLETEQLPK